MLPCMYRVYNIVIQCVICVSGAIVIFKKKYSDWKSFMLELYFYLIFVFYYKIKLMPNFYSYSLISLNNHKNFI